MKAIQLALEIRYADQNNLRRISEIMPAGSRTAVFAVRERYPFLRIIRGLFRRIVPFSIYRSVFQRVDEIADTQCLGWVTPLSDPLRYRNILLYPPEIEPSLGTQLVRQVRPEWIHSVPTGVDQVPVPKNGLLLTSSKGVHDERIAEFVMAVIFSSAKSLPAHVRQTRDRVWKSISSETIRGSCLGIVGLGRIGIAIARLAAANGMNVWAVKRKMGRIPCVDRVLPPENLSELLRNADYVVLSVPLTPQTKRMIGAKELGMMKPGACLINISRWEIVDEDALYEVLRHARIRCVYSDVYKDLRPPPKNCRFYRFQNMIFTGYSAYFSRQSTEQVMELFYDNLERFSNGEHLLHPHEP